jgi:hypothetical protein
MIKQSLRKSRELREAISGELDFTQLFEHGSGQEDMVWPGN